MVRQEKPRARATVTFRLVSASYTTAQCVRRLALECISRLHSALSSSKNNDVRTRAGSFDG